MQHFEKLGAFYLGKKLDPGKNIRTDEYLLYDSKDLTTHAVCVGMTGSGKTGLCIGVLEEAAVDGVPAIVIDPKGDMTNLMLSFPDLAPESFEPWINQQEAVKAGMSSSEYAQEQAEIWKNGIEEWGQDADRIKSMRETTEFTLYTPGSTSGKPLSIISALSLPPDAVRKDPESLHDLVSGTAAGLLGLLGLDTDPIKSSEHILISNILLSTWKSGRDMDLAGLIGKIQTPPFEQIGVMDLESFYPKDKRFELSMKFNNLLASPGFSSWVEGDPLDIDSLLYTDSGKPRISILSIPHLSEQERMFFVSLLLNKIVAWVRSQPGTSSLRAILYMDEIYGFFPPVSQPPSKAPLLTLLKQARAYGLGVMLTTQNPVDLDYKGLSNMGTWFIGRLQTDRDKARLLDGLEGAVGSMGNSFDRKEMDALISGLDKRVFLMNNIHDPGPTLFETRWCLSYLRGPLMRNEIRQLTGDGQEKKESTEETKVETQTPLPSETVSAFEAKPEIPEKIKQVYLPVSGDPKGITYRPSLTAFVEVHFSDTKNGISETIPRMLYTSINDGLVPVDWNESEEINFLAEDLSLEGIQGASYADIPKDCLKSTSFTEWGRQLKDHLYRNYTLTLFRNDHLKKISRPGESERDFRIRLTQESREERDSEIEKLRDTYAKKAVSLEEKIRKAQQAVDREKDQAKDAGLQTAISLGSTILSALLGTKKISTTSMGRAATTVRGVSRSMRQKGDVDRSIETLNAYEEQLKELDGELQTEIDELTDKIAARAEDIYSQEIKPLKRDCLVKALAFTWEPVRISSSGIVERAW